MNEDALNDLKQFITATVSQQLSLHLDEFKEGFKTEIFQKIDETESRLSKQIQDLSDSVAEAMTTQNDEVGNQLKNHETRITALETKPA